MSNNFKNTHFQDNAKYLDIFQELTILMVDDDENILFFITEVFEIYEINIITTSNGLKAFEIIEQCEVDLLISNINMPGKDGYWLINKVRKLASPRKREIPAVAFTGSTEYQKILASGFNLYIQKPSPMQKLIREIAKLLQSSAKSVNLEPGQQVELRQNPDFLKKLGFNEI